MQLLFPWWIILAAWETGFIDVLEMETHRELPETIERVEVV